VTTKSELQRTEIFLQIGELHTFQQQIHLPCLPFSIRLLKNGFAQPKMYCFSDSALVRLSARREENMLLRLDGNIYSYDTTTIHDDDDDMTEFEE
jgi:hypothetical protein